MLGDGDGRWRGPSKSERDRERGGERESIDRTRAASAVASNKQLCALHNGG